MEHPHDPYHVRPFPQQPHRGGKELISVLDDLETIFSIEVPDLEKLRTIQRRMHETANHYNDDRLVDMLRTLSHHIDKYLAGPAKALLEKIITTLLKVRLELKHLRS